MPRNLFFNQLKKLLAENYRQQNDAINISRRKLIGMAALASTATLTGCHSTASFPLGKKTHYQAGAELDTIVIGAGLAGLHCTYRLKESGVNVALFEASDRTGGRIFSTDKGYFEGGQVAELGGELIDSTHYVMRHFSQEFNLQLDNLPNSLPQNMSYGYQYYFDDKFISQNEIIDAFKPIDKAIRQINLELAELEYIGLSYEVDKRRKEIDANNSVLKFLVANDASATLINIIRFAFIGEFGLEIEQLSVFNLLDLYPCSRNGSCYQFSSDHDGKQKFKPFGRSDEIMRFHDGNEGPAKEMTKRLADTVHLNHILIKLEKTTKGYKTTFKNKEDEIREFDAPNIVLALPFSTLRKVNIAEGTLRKSTMDIIQRVNYGTNSKLAGQFQSRKPWRKLGHDGSLITNLKAKNDREIHNLWDSSCGQEADFALWTNSVGGAAGYQVGEGTGAEQWKSMIPRLNSVYPGIENGFLGNTARMLWPIHKWALGSYMAIKPGDIELVSHMPHDENGGSLQFCGEHTSEAFRGFMEGAAETGARAAAAILARLNAPQSENLSYIQQLRLAQLIHKPHQRTAQLEFTKNNTLTIPT